MLRGKIHYQLLTINYSLKGASTSIFLAQTRSAHVKQTSLLYPLTVYHEAVLKWMN